MTTASSQSECVLVLAPTGRDAALVSQSLARAGIVAENCLDINALCAAVMAGAGAAIITAEVFNDAVIDCLTDVLQQQPPWSDLPLLIFSNDAREGEALVKRL